MKASYLQALLQQGIAAAKAGQPERARQILTQVIEADETKVQAWLWLSSVVDDPTDKFICLQNVLKLEPDNKPAQFGLARLEQRPDPSPPPKPPPKITSPAQTPPTLAEAKPHLKPLKKLGPRPKAAATKAQPSSPQVAQSGCPFCHRPISLSVMICPHCHLPLTVDCPRCSTRLDVEQQTCSQCGQSLGNFRRKLAYFAGLATAYQEHEHPAKALTAWQVVETINPDFPQLQVHLGEAQAAAGRTDVAISNLRQALEQDPGQVAAALALGKIYHQLHQWSQAQTIYTQALAHTPDSPQLHFALGDLLLELGQATKARSHLLKATRLNPQQGTAWLRLGQLYEVTRNSRQAVQAYRRAAALLPSGTLARKQAQQGLEVLDPALPDTLASGWAELFRQMAGPILICLLAVLLDSGLRPWWIPASGWVALLLSMAGSFLWTTGASLPRNPAVCVLAGVAGLTSRPERAIAMVMGGMCWLSGLGIILYPLGQSFPEVPL